MTIGPAPMSTIETLIEVAGRVNFGAKLQPIVFDAASMSYRAIGDIVGKAGDDGKIFTE